MVTGAQARIETGEWPEPRRRLVITDVDTDGLLGLVTAAWESEETNWLLIGIVVFDPEHWGRGLGYEALGLWCDYLLTAMPELARLDLRTWSGNHGMMALARKLGFTEEARFRKARIVRGEYYDGMGYGILREEWDARYWDGFAASLYTWVTVPRFVVWSSTADHTQRTGGHKVRTLQMRRCPPDLHHGLQQVGDDDAIADFKIAIPRFFRQLRLDDRLRIVSVAEEQPRIGTAVNRVALHAFEGAFNRHATISAPSSSSSSARRSSRLRA